MKKVYSLLLASLLTMSMFAQTKTIATVEKLWSGEPLGWTTADTRQWAGFGEYVYWESKANHTIYGTHDGVTVDTIYTNDAIDGTAFCLDEAGNFIVEGVFPNTPSHVFLLKHDTTAHVDIPITGLARTDIVTATGDVFSPEGGFVFLYGNSANLLVLAIKNAATANQEVIVKEIAIAGSNVQNYVIAGDTAVQYVQRRSSGQTGFDKYENGVNVGTIAGMTGYKGSTLSGAMVTLGGKLFAVYPAGTTVYSSEFSVANLTDSALVVDKADATKTIFYANTTTRSNTTNVGTFVTATKIDENNAYLQVGNGSDGTALFKLNVTVSAEVTLSCNEAQGTVSGGGDIAVGANATVVATPKPGFEFVAWKKGDETVSTSATYTFAVTENVALTAIFEAKDNVTITLAVNDANLGSINLPVGIAMGANSVVYGTPVELTAVPANGATFMGWFEGETLYAADYTITLNSKANISLTAKFVNALVLSYELNGGVTNDANWVSKGNVMLEIQNDYNARYNASLAVVKYENGVYYFKINDDWVPEAQAIGNTATVSGFFQNKTWSADQKCANLFLNNPKYQFLVDLIDYFKGTAHQAADDPSGLGRGTENIADMAIGTADAYFRADVSGFMLNSPITTAYPYTCNWMVAGLPEAYAPVWGHAFANPTEVVTEITLNAPYKEGYTFDGWYANADFSGAKVTTVGPESNIPGNKLYAKWIEYIPTIAEATAAPQGDTVKVGGVVTFIRGTKNVYIQDATGGLLIYTKDNATCKVGDFIVARGKNTTYGGAPEIEKATVNVKDSAQALPAELPISLANLVADPLKHFGERVVVEGLVIASYDNNGNAFVTDGVDTVQCYYVTPDQSALPVGSRVNLHLIAAYFNKFQFVGPNDGIQLAPLSGVDPFTYPALGDNNEYTLTNKWLYSNVMDNFSANKPAPDDYARGMVAKDGKMYFINRSTSSFTVVDGATGEMLDPIAITGDHLFQTPDPDSIGKYNSCATLAFNDVKLDQAGHFLIGGCVSGGNRVQIYKVDIATGAATNIIDERLYDNPDWGAELDSATTKWRFDAFNVYGDVDGNAVVMAADANSFYAYKWDITNGVAGAAERINCTPEPTDVSLIVKDGGLTVSAFGTAPQIFPVDFNYFYVDGWNTLPMLFDMDGTLMEDFATCPTGVHVPMMGADTMAMNMGHNGLCEFQIGNEYFLVMAATNTVGKPTSAFAIYKFADAAKSFADMEPMWYFPKAGMGAATNGCRTAVPSVEVKDDIATIYIYTNNNGYGVYQMKGVLSGLNNVNGDANVQKVIKNGQVYIIKNGVEYTVLGVEVK